MADAVYPVRMKTMQTRSKQLAAQEQSDMCECNLFSRCHSRGDL